MAFTAELLEADIAGAIGTVREAPEHSALRRIQGGSRWTLEPTTGRLLPHGTAQVRGDENQPSIPVERDALQLTE